MSPLASLTQDPTITILLGPYLDLSWPLIKWGEALTQRELRTFEEQAVHSMHLAK